jgi:hypothetical protein
MPITNDEDDRAIIQRKKPGATLHKSMIAEWLTRGARWSVVDTIYIYIHVYIYGIDDAPLITYIYIYDTAQPTQNTAIETRTHIKI